MIAIPASLTSFFAGRAGSPLWTVRIYKSEGTDDPDGGTDYWPGSGLATAFRIFTSRRPSWSDTAAQISAGALFVDRLNRECLHDLTFRLASEREAGGLAGKASFSFEVDNTDGLFRTFEEQGVRLEGRRVYLLLGSADDTTATGGNDLVLFTGRITDIQGTGMDRVKIEAEGIDEAFDRDIPPTLFHNEGSAYEDDFLPTYTKGKPIPLVFGEHDQAEGFTTSDVHDTGAADGAKVVQFVDPAIGFGIKSLVAGRWGDGGLVASGDGFAEIVNATVGGMDLSIWSASADNASIRFRDFDDYLNLWIPVRLHSWARHLASAQTGTHDERNAIDASPTTWTRFDAAGPNSSWIAVYKVPQIGISGQVIFDAHPDPYVYAHLSAVAASTLVYVSNTDYEAIIVQIQTGKNTAPRATGAYNRLFHSLTTYSYPAGSRSAMNRVDDFVSTRPTRANFEELSAFSKLWVLVGVNTVGATGPSPQCDLFDVWLELLAHIQWPDEGFYATVQGYQDDTPSVYTGTAAALIENPAHVLAFLWGTCSLAASTDVDITGHRAVASGARSGWKVAKQILEQQAVSAYVDELARETFLWSWFDELGKAKVFPMQAVSVGATALTLTPNDLPGGEIDSYDLTPLEEVVTDFVVRYHENPVTRGFDGEVICNETEASSELGASYSSACAWARFNTGGKSVRRVFDLTWVRDRTTAVEIAKRLIAFHGGRRYLVTVTGDALRFAAVQIGDSVNFEVGGFTWPASLPSGLLSAQYRVIEKRVAPASDTITLKLGQVFE